MPLPLTFFTLPTQESEAPDNLKPIEENVFIEYLTNPRKLLTLRKLKKHWKLLKSYMNMTALEGKINTINRLKTWYLRNFKEVIVHENIQKPKAVKVCLEILKYVATVGLSGFLILIFSSIKTSNDETLNQKIIRELLNNLTTISKEIDTLGNKVQNTNTILMKIENDIVNINDKLNEMKTIKKP
jgi:hypothetical protein